jgi:hypothetical protein
VENHLLIIGDLASSVLDEVAKELSSVLPSEKFVLPQGACVTIMSGLGVRAVFGDLQVTSAEDIAARFETEQGVPMSNAAVVVVENGLFGSSYGVDEVLIDRFPGAQAIFVADNNGMLKRVK